MILEGLGQAYYGRDSPLNTTTYFLDKNGKRYAIMNITQGVIVIRTITAPEAQTSHPSKSQDVPDPEHPE